MNMIPAILFFSQLHLTGNIKSPHHKYFLQIQDIFPFVILWSPSFTVHPKPPCILAQRRAQHSAYPQESMEMQVKQRKGQDLSELASSSHTLVYCTVQEVVGCKRGLLSPPLSTLEEEFSFPHLHATTAYIVERGGFDDPSSLYSRERSRRQAISRC